MMEVFNKGASLTIDLGRAFPTPTLAAEDCSQSICNGSMKEAEDEHRAPQGIKTP